MTDTPLAVLSRYVAIAIMMGCGVTVAVAQTYEYMGYVEDSLTRERLIYVHIYDSVSGVGTQSNASGYFRLVLKEQPRHLFVSHIGYRTARVDVAGYSAWQTILLEPAVWLEAVTVGPDISQQRGERLGSYFITAKQLKFTPAIMGERDPFKVLQLLPGVQGGTEGSSGYFVRGGSYDQNLILLDGVTLYGASHVFGFLSTVNPDAVKSMELLTGGFPARYAGRLSSVLDIMLKDGNATAWHSDLSLGMLASRLNVEGPLSKGGKTTLSFSARRSVLDLVAKEEVINLLGVARSSKIDYHFYDLHLKIKHDLTRRDRLFLSVYRNTDAFFRSDVFPRGNEFDEFFDWSNQSVALRWNRVWSPRVYSHVKVIGNQYRYHSGFESRPVSPSDSTYNSAWATRLDYEAGIKDIALQFQVDYQLDPFHSFQVGGGNTWHHNDLGTFDIQQGILGRVRFQFPQISTMEGGIHGEYHWRPNRLTHLSVGGHLSSYYHSDWSYLHFQPRLSFTTGLAKHLQWSASAGRMVQYLHLLSNEGPGAPTDLWITSTGRIRPAAGWLYSTGLSSYVKQIRISLEGYYRHFDNAVNFQAGTSLLSEQDWEDKVIQGRGEGYGMEFMASTDRRRWNAQVSYTLSWAYRQFEELNRGSKYPFAYDRRHKLNLSSYWRVHRRWTLSGTWVFQSGLPFTLFLGSVPQTEITGPPPHEFFVGGACLESCISARNAFRLDAYQRLDVDVNYVWHVKKGHNLSAGLYNAYNRKNPFRIHYDYKSRVGPSGIIEKIGILQQTHLFPVLPYVNFNFIII